MSLKTTLGLAISLLSPFCMIAADPISNENATSYRLLATKSTATMQREMNKAAAQGCRFSAMMGGKTTFGGREVVAAMARPVATSDDQRFEYKLLATKSTATMQRELRAAGEKGYTYAGQSVAEMLFGGNEVLVILERSVRETPARYVYKLLATKRTKTMRNELSKAGSMGFKLQGLTVSETSFGGRELVSILVKTESY